MERQRVQLLNPALRTNSQVGGAAADPIQFAEIEACAALGTYSTELASLPAVDPSLASVQFDVSPFFVGSDNEAWANVPAPQSSGLDNQLPCRGATDMVAHRGGYLAQDDGAAAQDLEHGEPQLASPPMESLHGQVNHLQLLVFRYMNKLQDVQHQLMECEVQKSELQCEVEDLRSKLQRVTKSQVATWSAFSTGIDIQ